MPTDPLQGALLSPASYFWPFLFILARLGGAIAFIPIPGFRSSPAVPKAILALGLSWALTPVWASEERVKGSGNGSLWWLFGEAGFGTFAGAIVGWLSESVLMGMQIIGTQAGYSYASTIDPTTQADSTVLQTLAQLLTGSLFFLTGFDREIVKLFAQSLETFPPGSFQVTAADSRIVIEWISSCMTLAVRLALPITGLLLMVDLSLAFLGRLHAQLQTLSLAFPAKMLLTIVLASAAVTTIANVYATQAAAAARILWNAAGGRR